MTTDVDLALIPLETIVEELRRRFDTLVLIADRAEHPEGEWLHRCHGDPFRRVGLARGALMLEEAALAKVLAAGHEREDDTE